MSSGRFLLVILLVGVGCSTVPKTFDPPAPIPAAQFSHELFDRVLRAHVHDGAVDYPGIAEDGRFDFYLRQLDRVDPNGLPTRSARLAFWINAYNAFAIKGILDGYSPRTLVGRYRYFIARDYGVGGERLNLYDLERDLLIPEFDEPRIHFAIVCASRSCPALQSRAFREATLEEQLERAARAFINDPERNRFDRERKIAYLSRIFEWFEEDFAAQAGSLLAYVRRYVADPVLARDLEATPYTIRFQEYDWRLNGRPPARMAHARGS